ncbi:MAG: hypothetical protein GWN58_04885, partial [Anaerolineae bacterium]|nr:hypothetical protein [Anaerolineae bacterium]
MTGTLATITFTASSGTLSPVNVDTVEGVAIATFTASGSPGQATIFATTGEITGTVHIQVGQFEPDGWLIYLPLICKLDHSRSNARLISDQ